jgi:hypothetical protein
MISGFGNLSKRNTDDQKLINTSINKGVRCLWNSIMALFGLRVEEKWKQQPSAAALAQNSYAKE